MSTSVNRMVISKLLQMETKLASIPCSRVKRSVARKAIWLLQVLLSIWAKFQTWIATSPKTVILKGLLTVLHREDIAMIETKALHFLAVRSQEQLSVSLSRDRSRGSKSTKLELITRWLSLTNTSRILAFNKVILLSSTLWCLYMTKLTKQLIYWKVTWSLQKNRRSLSRVSHPIKRLARWLWERLSMHTSTFSQSLSIGCSNKATWRMCKKWVKQTHKMNDRTWRTWRNLLVQTYFWI